MYTWYEIALNLTELRPCGFSKRHHQEDDDDCCLGSAAASGLTSATKYMRNVAIWQQNCMPANSRLNGS